MAPKVKTGLRDHIERVCHRLLQRPVYLLLGSEVSEQFRPQGSLALTGRGLDIIFCDQIGSRWRGRGAVILLNDGEIRSYVRKTYRVGPQRIYVRRAMWQLAMHEIVHLALRVILPSEQDDNPNPVLTSAYTENLMAFCVATSPAALSAVPWARHDGNFIRILCHVAHRARLIVGEWLPGNGWFNPRQYGLPSREDEYVSAIGDEPKRLTGVPLPEISAGPPPPRAFIYLWKRSVSAWFSTVENPSDEQTAALVRGLRLFSSTPCSLSQEKRNGCD